jgi:hypothetical protein
MLMQPWNPAPIKHRSSLHDRNAGPGNDGNKANKGKAEKSAPAAGQRSAGVKGAKAAR